MNAISPHIHEIKALDLDVLALQEVRIGSDATASVHQYFAQDGFNVFFGTLPNYKVQGHNKRSIHLDQLIPGVAFVVKSHLPVQELSSSAMNRWEKLGRFLAIKVFINNKWVTCISAYAPTQDSAPFLQEMSDFLHELAHEDCVFCADINADSREGLFVHDLQARGWYALTINTTYDFYTYKHSNGQCSCIDTTAVTECLKDNIAPVSSHQVLDKGHFLCKTSREHSFSAKADVGSLSST